MLVTEDKNICQHQQKLPDSLVIQKRDEEKGPWIHVAVMEERQNC